MPYFHPLLCLSITDALTLTTTTFSSVELMTFFVFAARGISMVQGKSLFQNFTKVVIEIAHGMQGELHIR